MAVGINIATSGNTIGGTASGAGNLISGNTSDGVSISGTAATGNLIAGNLIGPNAGGTAAVANASDGVDIEAPGNTIGGTASGSANVISGNKDFGVIIFGGNNNAPNNVVAGNFIGTNAAGTAAVANSTGVGIENVTGTNTIGGTTAAARNVILGNTSVGVFIVSDAGVVEGNFIGTDPTGQLAVANGEGVSIYEGSGSTIGGLTSTPGTGPGNVISGNTSAGIEIDVGSQNIIVGNIVGLQANGSGLIANSNGATGGINLIGASTGNVIGGTVSGAANVISGNAGSGIVLNESNGALVAGNLIGTDAGGTLNRGNAVQGVEIFASSGDTIGGSTAAARNIISGNGENGIFVENQATRDRGIIHAIAATNNLIEGNFIGTDVTGTAGLGNADYGVELAYDASGDSSQVTSTSANTIGGTTPGAANVISGNTTGGIEITGSSTSDNVVAGDFLGTDITGTVAIANGTGVEIDTGASANTIGGTTALARNIISGNTAWGVAILPSATDNVVEGDFIGADVTGDVALANTIGVYIHSSDNTIGGTAAGAGNVIAGNADAPLYDRAQVLIRNNGSADNVVEGNLIGLGANGQAFSGAVNVGVWLDNGATGNTIGGTTAAARNVISGNLGGVQLNGDAGDVVEGNYIGTNIAGTSGIGNGTLGSGITDENGTDDTIGGSVAGAGNVISGNAGNGVYILDGNAADNLIQGNIIGLDYTGTVRISNSNDIFFDNTSGGNTIGGATSAPGTGAGNIIAYSGHSGIAIDNDAAGDVILGNAIIDNATNPSIPETGVFLSGDIDPHVGGTGAGDGNLISGNNGDGIAVQDSTNTLVQGNSDRHRCRRHVGLRQPLRRRPDRFCLHRHHGRRHGSRRRQRHLGQHDRRRRDHRHRHDRQRRGQQLHRHRHDRDRGDCQRHGCRD